MSMYFPQYVCKNVGMYIHVLVYVCKPGRLTRATSLESLCGFCGLCFQNSIAQYIPTLCGALPGRALSTKPTAARGLYVWMNTYACMYIWIRIYENARILVSFAAQAPRTKHQLESMKLLCCTLHSVFQNEIKVGYLKPH